MPRIDYTGVPEEVSRSVNGLAKNELTVGDGKCAIHSVFGQFTIRGWLLHNAGAFLARTCGATFETFSDRIKDRELLAELQETLWLELVKPRAVSADFLNIDEEHL